jgi:hypothetical protein
MKINPLKDYKLNCLSYSLFIMLIFCELFTDQSSIHVDSIEPTMGPQSGGTGVECTGGWADDNGAVVLENDNSVCFLKVEEW